MHFGELGQIVMCVMPLYSKPRPEFTDCGRRRAVLSVKYSVGHFLELSCEAATS